MAKNDNKDLLPQIISVDEALYGSGSGSLGRLDVLGGCEELQASEGLSEERRFSFKSGRLILCC